ncbi:serine protease [Actibacterium sp. MT2.3-13A]|uniref:serine protease n=1 Tax=Actibacterium sp. MT2.3-13A TaxID=2828332 RepID=UPI001BA9EDF6|nr:serine protease [Actibacterium sp. MT2.3-13A]
MKALISLLFFTLAGLAPAAAQDRAWVQIEAHPTLREAQERARAYAGAFPDVNGFQMRSGWYAIALGPFTPEGALARLGDLRGDRLVPGDSYVSDGAQYTRQFWPVGADRLTAAPAAPAVPAAPAAAAPQQAPAAAAPTPVILPDETPAEARRSEAQLTREEREELQQALQWEGFYESAIDGDFGRGTRAAMADWQAARGHEPTGVLTARQRHELVSGYRETLARLGMRTVTEARAGIQIDLPAGLVDFARYEAPFVHYEGKGDSGVRVLLISQSGDQGTLYGLYDIMQTLEIVPLKGRRERNSSDFVLTGQSDTLHSYTYAALSDGAVKGFTLVWRPEDARLMNRAARMMRESFVALPGAVLPDLAGEAGEEQRVDLMAGLEIRTPAVARTGFYVDERGAVLTTTEVLDQCARLTIADEYEAEVAARDDALGLAVLRPRQTLAPLAHAAFQTATPRLQSDVAVAGFSYGGVLDQPVLTYGTLADLRGLNGEDGVQRLSLAALPGDAGGPVFDATGAVMGVLLARADGARQLPQDVSFAASVPAIADFLSVNGVTVEAAEPAAQIAPEMLALKAADMTVLVSCWN